jgi:hypothetical protein
VKGVESHISGEPELLAHEVVDPNRPRHEDPNFVQTVRAALEDNRIDVYLQPIVSLPQRKLRFYEALSRLRDSQGEIIMPKEYLYVAEPAGLMTVIDNLLLFRCVQVVRQLAKKNPGMAIFCNISMPISPPSSSSNSHKASCRLARRKRNCRSSAWPRSALASRWIA